MSDEVSIQPKEHGPYLVRGPFTLLDAWGAPYALGDKTIVALCRCGQSGTKPFCDGTHMKVDFEAGERAPSAE